MFIILIMLINNGGVIMNKPQKEKGLIKESLDTKNINIDIDVIIKETRKELFKNNNSKTKEPHKKNESQ